MGTITLGPSAKKKQATAQLAATRAVPTAFEPSESLPEPATSPHGWILSFPQ
jgi:hypothetical protein